MSYLNREGISKHARKVLHDLHSRGEKQKLDQVMKFIKLQDLIIQPQIECLKKDVETQMIECTRIKTTELELLQKPIIDKISIIESQIKQLKQQKSELLLELVPTHKQKMFENKTECEKILECCNDKCVAIANANLKMIDEYLKTEFGL